MRTQSKIFFSPLPSALLHLTCIFCLLSAAAFSQPITFEKYYDFGATEEGYSVQQTKDGGYIIAGQQRIGIGFSNILLQKVDSIGQTQWVKFIGNSYDNQAWAVKQTSEGGYIVTGYTTNASYDNMIYLIKTDSNGDTTWTKKLSTFPPFQMYGKDVIQTLDGGFLVTCNGSYYSTDTAQIIYLIKTKVNGDTLWTKKFKRLSGVWGGSLKQTTDGGYVIAGNVVLTTNPSAKFSVYLIKTDTNGDTLWTKIIADTVTNNVRAYSVQQTSDGGYFMTGAVYYPAILSTDVYLVKTNASGDTLWTRKIGGAGDEGGVGQQTFDGGYIIAGSTTSFGSGSTDAYLLKTDSGGNKVWEKAFGSVSQDQGNSIQQTTDGGFVIAGITAGDVYLIKTDSDGVVMTGVDELESKRLYLKIYPNPFFSYANVEMEKEGAAPGYIVLYDAIGKEVKRINVENSSFIICRDGLPDGLYFLNVYNSSDQIIARSKIIIQ